jgi:hypothetical protein
LNILILDNSREYQNATIFKSDAIFSSFSKNFQTAYNLNDIDDEDDFFEKNNNEIINTKSELYKVNFNENKSNYFLKCNKYILDTSTKTSPNTSTNIPKQVNKL